MKIPKISTLMNSIQLFKKVNDLIDVSRMPLERSKAYNLGDVVHVYALPSNLYLECTQAGTTSFYDLNLSTTVGAVLTDGTAKWTVRDVKGSVKSVNNALPDTNGNVQIAAGEAIGFMSLCINGIVPAGWIPVLGAEYTRATYSSLYNDYAVANNLVISESAWQELYESQNGNVPYFSSGNGTTTFRVPSIRGWLKSQTTAGQFIEAGLPNITGEFLGKVDGDCTGAFYKSENRSRAFNGSDTNNRTAFDASRSSAIYGKSDTVQPFGMSVFYIMKAYGVVTNAGETDVSELAEATQRVEQKLDSIDVVAQGDEFIRYANGLQICWGTNKETDKTYTVINYPMPFSNEGEAPSVTIGTSADNAIRMSTVNDVNTTSFQLLKNYADMWVCWMAIGWWK